METACQTKHPLILFISPVRSARRRCRRPEFRRNCASSHCDFGVALASRGQLAEAVDEYQSALSLDAECWQAYFNLALIYEGLHRLDAAIDAYEKTIAANPACAEAHNNLGVLLAKT
ncbi:MAG: tetratricopeptide repeat protein, partial [Planctomycetota bacterium]